MSVTKITGVLETKAVMRVWFGGHYLNIKPESFKEESEGYTFKDENGYTYFTTQWVCRTS